MFIQMFQVTDTLRWIVFSFTEMDTNIVTVERIQEFINLKPEADWRIEETKPAADWPQRGHVKISNFSLRYREGLDLVLKEIDCDIKPGEKVNHFMIVFWHGSTNDFEVYLYIVSKHYIFILIFRLESLEEQVQGNLH